MDMHWTRRAAMGAALSAMAAPAIAVAQEKTAAGQGKSTAAPALSAAIPAAATPAATAPVVKGKLTNQSLGTLLKAMGLEAKASEQRYDFTIRSTVEEAEWVFPMTAVLSRDESSIWIMAWLDELPKSAADVPRTALLRLLSDNDKLGKGKFFAYIAADRRFVLQRVIPNENITSVGFNAALQDLGESVVIYQAHWSVANWASSTGDDPAAAAKTGAQTKGSAPQSSAPSGAVRPAGQTQPTADQTQPAAKPVQSAVNDSKFSPTIKK